MRFRKFESSRPTQPVWCAVTKSLNLALLDLARHCVDAGIIADSSCFVLAALIRRLPNCWARPRGRAAAHSHRTAQGAAHMLISAFLCEGPHSHSGPNLIHLSGEFWRSRSSFPPSISAWMEAIVVIGAVIALEMVIGSVGVPRATPVIEQRQDDFRQLPLINRETPPSLETDAPVNDREQLRRYFLQDSPGRLRR